MSTKLGTLTLDLVARIGSFTQGMRDASASAEREMGRAGNSVNTMDGLLKKLAATAGTVFSVSQITNYADSYTGMVNKMKLVTDGQNQLSTAMGDTHKIAQATASDWSSVVDVYTKFQKISDRLGLSQSEVARITETVTKAVGISGASADEAQRSLVQFSQALSLGVLRGQDLNSVMQQTPGLTDAIAKGMGVTSDKLKQMGSDGVLTTQKVVEALQKVAGSIDADYAETATLIASSFSLVKNEAIKMIGEFDQAHGISQTFVQGMTAVADNLEDITKVMAIAGAYMAGTYIPMIIKGTYATVSDTVSKVANIVALRAKAVADYDVAKSNLAATAAMARAMGATNAQTAAMMTNARAAYQQAAAAKAAALSGAGLSSALLGPVGVGIALASVAAGYIYMSSKGAEANEMLESQSRYAGMAADELLRLDGAKRKAAQEELSKEVGILNDKLKASENQFEALVEKVLDSNSANAEAKKIWSELRAGAISVDEAYSRLNQTDFVTSKQINQLTDGKKKVDDAKSSLKQAETAQKALASATGNATGEIKKQAQETAELNAELKKLFDQANQNIKNSQITTALAKHGYSDEMIALAQKYMAVQGAVVKNEQGLWRLRPDVQKQFNEEWIALQKQKSALDVRNDAEKARTKELEKHAKLIKASTIDAVISNGEGNYNSVNLGQKGGYKASTRNLTSMTVAQVLSAQKAKEFNAAGKYQTINSTLQAAVDAGVVSSAEKFSEEVQERIFKQYLVALKRPEIKGFITGNTGASLNDALLGAAKEFASVANPSTGKSYYAGQGNNKASISAEKMTESLLAQQKVYRENIALGMSSEQAWLKSFNASATVTKTEEVDLDKFLEDMIKRKQDQAQKQKEIQLGIANETVRIQEELKDKIKEINESGFDDAETARLKAEYTTRAENEIKIAESAHADKLAEYSAYVKTEEQLINESYNRRQRDLKLDLELTHDEYTQASLNLETMRKRELEANQRDQELELLEIKQDWMDKGKYAQEYYALVRAEILATANYSPEKKDALIKKANAKQGMDENQKREGVWAEYTDRFGAKQLPFDQDAALLKAARDEMLITEEEYQKERLALQMTYGSKYGADFAGMMMGLVDSSSSAYAVLGAVQKGAALFSTAMNSYTAISAAWASAPFPYNLPAVGMATMETGLLQAAVSAMTPLGMAHDGIDNIPREGTWLLDKGERVVDKRTNGDLKDFIAKGGNGPQINIITPPGYEARQSTDSNGALTIEMVRKDMVNQIGDRNSQVNKAMRNNFNISAKG